MNLSFIKLDINILDDTKIKLLRKHPDGDKLFVLWIGLLCIAMKSDKTGYVYITNGVPYTEQDLSILFGIEYKTIQMGIELFKQYKMIDVINGGVIEIINFNKHQEIEKIERVKELSRETSKRYREKQKTLLNSDNDVTISDNTDKIRLDKTRLDNKQIETLYKLYPSRDINNNNRSTSKSSLDKKKISSLIKKISYNKLLSLMQNYIDDCDKTKSYILNLSSFLNQLPEVEPIFKSDSPVYKEKPQSTEKVSKYANIQTEENYMRSLKTGLFYEIYPELKGNWNKDKNIILNDN